MDPIIYHTLRLRKKKRKERNGSKVGHNTVEITVVSVRDFRVANDRWQENYTESKGVVISFHRPRKQSGKRWWPIINTRRSVTFQQ